jgi:O-antigen/teichoic acid export membrane protein
LRQIARFNRASWVPEVLRFCCVLALAVSAYLTVGTAMAATVAASAAMCVYAAWTLAPMLRVRWRIDPRVMASMLSMGVVFGLALFLINLNYRAGTLLLQQSSTLEQIGYFALAVTLAELVWQIPGTLSTIVFSRSASARDDAAFSRKTVVLMRLTVAASAIAALGLVAVSPWFVPLLYGPDFAPAVPIIALLMPGIVAMAAFKILNVELGGKGKPWVSMLVVVPALALNFGAGWVLVGEYGALGAAAAASLAYVTLAVAYVGLYCRVSGMTAAEVLRPRRSDLALLAARVPLLRRFA